MKRSDALDILKYFACFLVIVIHMDIPVALEIIVRPLLTTAVPIFFMITGFFYSETIRREKTKEQIRKIVMMTLVANLIHIGWRCFKLMVNKESILTFIVEVVNSEALLNLFLFNQPIWRISIWYINALLIVLALVYIVRKWYDLQKFYMLIPVLLIFNLVLGTYSFILPGHESILLCYSRNFLFCGMPYFLLGNYMFSKKQSICKLFGQWWCVVVFWILGCVELYVLKSLGLLRHSDHIASSFFLSLSLFCVFAKGTFDVGKLGEKISKLGRKHSFVIYVSHSIIIEIFYKIVYMAGDIPLVINVFSYIGPILVLIISTLFAHLIACCKNIFVVPQKA